MKPTVFVGSSSEGLAIAEAVQQNLEKDCDIEPWTQGAFELNKANLENLFNLVRNFDFAVLVLTPDDIIESRGSMGSVPRDNVIFELGLFLGSLGRDRTFAIYPQDDNLKLPTDLDGISFIKYRIFNSGNLSASLGATCTKIKQQIKKIGLRPKKSESSRRVPQILERGSTDSIDFVADATLYLAERRYEFSDELRRFVAAGHAVPMKYLYWSQAASRHWLRLCQQEAYSFYRDSLDFLRDVSSDLVKLIIEHSGSPEIDFISLGSGDGQKDLQLLLAVTNSLSEHQHVYYYPIDISDSLIVEAIRTTTGAGISRSKLRLKAIIGDFLQLRNYQHIYEYRPSNNVFSILGNSLGNADELQIIESLNNVILPGDFVLIEVNIGDPETMFEKARNSLNMQHDFTPLASLGISFDPTLMDYSIEEGKSNIRDTKSLIATYQEAELDGSTLRNINLSIVHHYQLESLLDYLQRRVRLQILWHQCKNEVGLILAKRS